MALSIAVFSEHYIASASQIITNQLQLQNIGLNPTTLTTNYTLGNDIEVTSPSGSGNYYIEGEFLGILDGRNFIIRGLTKPLFEEIGASNGSTGAQIKDLKLHGEVINGAGLLAKQINILGQIQNVGAEGRIIDSNNQLDVGGLIGINYGSVNDSYARVEVNSNNYDPSVGGLVGENRGQISNSYSLGHVSAISSGSLGEIGGLVGLNSGAINNSFSEGDVSVTNFQQGVAAGGLVGANNYGDIDNSFASGSVNGVGSVGGLVGSNIFRTIENSYSTGDVNGVLWVGGLVGQANQESTIRGSYSTSNVSCSGTPETCGALIGWKSDQQVVIENSIGTGQILINSVTANNPNRSTQIPSILDVIGITTFEKDPCFNLGKPILKNLKTTFSNSCQVDLTSNRNGRLNTIPNVTQSLIAKSLGFESSYIDVKNLGIDLYVSNSNDDKVMLNSIRFTANSSIELNLKINDKIQIQIDYLREKILQLWIKDKLGNHTFFGKLFFNSDGLVILPALQFLNAEVLDLILVDSVSIGQKPDINNQIGKLVINIIN